MICIQCKEAHFVSGTQMCRNDGRIFCEKLKKLVDGGKFGGSGPARKCCSCLGATSAYRWMWTHNKEEIENRPGSRHSGVDMGPESPSYKGDEAR